MKKTISCLALILLLSMLLSSCAAGLPGSELYFTAQDQAASFSSRVENLLAENEPIVMEGISEYAVLYNQNASPAVSAAVSALLAEIKARTGADLAANDKKSATKRILIGSAGEESAKQVAAQLSAAEFYVGFVGNDLVLQAKNELMLICAIQHLQTLLFPTGSAETLPSLYLPGDLSYTSPTLPCSGEGYTIVRAEKSSERAVAALTQLYEAFYAAVGTRISIKSDFASQGAATEILVGSPNRPECAAILENLAFNEYYIGQSGQKWMILAKNDVMLELAVSHFIAYFVQSADAAKNPAQKEILLPADFAFYYQTSGIMLADEGINRAVLIYPKRYTNLMMDSITKLQTLYKKLTGVALPAYADEDYPRRDDTVEILVGQTNRTESSQRQYLNLDAGRWCVELQADGRAIVVAANGDFALRVALERFGTMLTQQTASLNAESIYADEWGTIKEGVFRMLFLVEKLTLFAQDVPDLPASFQYSYSNYGYFAMRQKNADYSYYHQYNNIIRAAGFQQIAQSQKDGVSRTVYQGNGRQVTVTHTESTQILLVEIRNRRE